LAFDSSGNLFEVDGGDSNWYGSGFINEFTRSPNGSFNSPSTVVTGLAMPTGMALDSSGNLFVGTFLSANLYKIPLASMPCSVSNDNLLSTGWVPGGMAVDSSGNLLVTDAGAGNIYKFAPDGTQTTLASGVAVVPLGLAVDGSNNIYVAENALINSPLQSSFGLPAIASGSLYEFAPDGSNQTLLADGLSMSPGLNPYFVAVQPPPLPPPWPGDANGDGKVDINDLTIVLANYNQTGTTWSQGDFNGDGKVDINDLTVVLTNFGQTVWAWAGGVAPVPEPGMFALLAAAAVGLLVHIAGKRAR